SASRSRNSAVWLRRSSSVMSTNSSSMALTARAMPSSCRWILPSPMRRILSMMAGTSVYSWGTASGSTGPVRQVGAPGRGSCYPADRAGPRRSRTCPAGAGSSADLPDQTCSQVAALLDDDVAQPEPPRHPGELGSQLLGGLLRGVRLTVRGPDHQHPGGTVGLEVDPGHEPVAEEEGQDVVAEPALVGRHVDLDAVVEAEEPLGAFALPHHRVEGAQQRARRDPPGAGGPGVQVDRAGPVLDPGRQ